MAEIAHSLFATLAARRLRDHGSAADLKSFAASQLSQSQRQNSNIDRRATDAGDLLEYVKRLSGEDFDR